MREVACFLSSALYKANYPSFIGGMRKNERDGLRSQGAHAVAGSISELLENFHVRNYYQVQYLPYAIYLREIMEKIVGYPVSLLDTLHRRFIKSEATGGHDNCIEDDGSDDDDDETKEDEDSDQECTCCVELDNRATRLNPRDVLGIEHGSLADVYINNVGWPADKVPTINFNSRGLEMDVIRIVGKYYRVPNGSMTGFVTSGGTEGNFTGLWWQRDYLKRLSNGLRPILLTSDQTHYSIAKAAQQLDIDSRTIATIETGEIDCDELARVLDEIATASEQPPPVLMVANAGTTQTGAIDNLPKIHQLLIDKVLSKGSHVSIHMDAALMGAVLPIINPFGADVDYFNDLDVKTMAISGHNFFGSVTIYGLLLTTESFLHDCLRYKDVNVEYVMGLHDITPSGSRNGISVLSFHNTICGLYMHTDC